MSDNSTITTHANGVAAQPDLTRSHHSPVLSEPSLLESVASSSHQKKSKLQPVVKYQRCPYHEPIIQLVSFPSDGTRGHAGMDRYLREESHEQYAVFLRPDDGLLSLEKNCICGQNPKKDNSKL